MAVTGSKPNKPIKGKRSRLVVALVAAVFVGAIALDTEVVVIGSAKDARQQAFNPDKFGQEQFPRIRDMVIEKALDAAVLAAKLVKDKKAAIENHGTKVGVFAVMPVSLTGVVGEGNSGIFTINVEGGPKDTKIRVQTGPAINGTELRDLPGDIEFGAFKNQIEYQNAGAGINRAMSAKILSGLGRDTLPGKKISVTGVFKLINAKNWLITPVSLDVL